MSSPLSPFNAERGLADASDAANTDSSGILDSIKNVGNEALDLFGDITQSDVGSGKVDLSSLPRAEKIELLVDGTTSPLFGGSPWSVGLQLDASVGAQVHAQGGGTLAFALTAGVLTDLESKVRTVRYALVWDDTLVAETGNLDLSVLQTFLVVAIGDDPGGSVLTLWITDSDVHATLVKQGSRGDVDTIRTALVGEIGAASGDGPAGIVSGVFNKVTGFITTTQIGGLVALGAIAIVLIVIVKSQAANSLAKNVRAVV